MGMDLSYIAAMQEIKRLSDLVEKMPHDERDEICNDIEYFVEKMARKYKDKTEE